MILLEKIPRKARPSRLLALTTTLVVGALLASACARTDKSSEPEAKGDRQKVETVRFPTSCDPKVQSDFLEAVTVLHSFFYDESRRTFTGVTKKDPQCAMAHWGVAMTWYHPVWSPPTEEEFNAGLAAIAKAKDVGAETERERQYVGALAAFFCTPNPGNESSADSSCPAAHVERARNYAETMARLHAKYPKDSEAAAFYALALLGSAPPADPKFENQLRAGEVLQKLWRQDRNHPGVAHYLIHAFDYPPLADQGLPAAKVYARIAPRVPHALHMPSHTFTRRGMWRESIDTNLASAEAARAHIAKHHPGATASEELHALDYLAYGYLQTARNEEAREVVERVAKMDKTHPEVDLASTYAMGAIPARFALERQAWEEAAALSIPPRALWGHFPFAEAHLEFAHALGRARTGDLPGAQRAIDRLAELRDAATMARFEYFRKHVDVQVMAASGWLARAEGRDDEALKLLRQAADVEDALGKHPVTPGPVLPVRELLGSALLEIGRPEEALAAFEASLRISPNRFAGLYGAGQAAERANKREVASKYYRQLITLAKGGVQRPELRHAREYLDE